MHLRVLTSLNDVAADDWNALAGQDHPFLRYEFLHALESSGCTTEATGWIPQHLLLHGDDGGLLGAVPMYLKHHSYGEYVFDWAWADAYARSGLSYYPKLLVGVPFSPVTGPRVLLAPQSHAGAARAELMQGAVQRARDLEVSSLHWLFPPADEAAELERHGLLRRVGYQFHWQNRDYADFAQFLGDFSAQKRKKIKHERRLVADAGVTMETVTGAALTPLHWDRFYHFYQLTIRKHGAIPYLTPAFFHLLGAHLADRVVMVLARHGQDYVGAALNLRGGDTLYGRYWGGDDGYSGLHFETCYYTAIDYCITHGLRRFEAGAQGEHKLARGFLPVATYSAHWLSHPPFYRVIGDFLRRERDGVEYYMSELNEHTPFKQGP
jgi:predicted N-acyltransferase